MHRTIVSEGNQCALTNGTTGECKKISECPPILEEAKSGLRGNNGAGRCGFDSFVEIVCCPSSLKTKIGVRPSDRGKHNYKHYKANVIKIKVISKCRSNSDT